VSDADGTTTLAKQRTEARKLRDVMITARNNCHSKFPILCKAERRANDAVRKRKTEMDRLEIEIAEHGCAAPAKQKAKTQKRQRQYEEAVKK
jgi:hypothetical protein